MMAKYDMKPVTDQIGSNAVDCRRIKRIAQLESEIDHRRAEINRLKIAKSTNHQDQMRDESEDDGNGSDMRDNNKSGSLHNTLGELIALWEHRLAGDEGRLKRVVKPGLVRIATPSNMEAPPNIVYTTSMESDAASVTSTDTDVTQSASSLGQTRAVKHFLLNPFISHERNVDSTIHTEELKSMIEERDMKISSLKATISSDIFLIKKMKDTIEILVENRTESESISSKKITQLEKALALQTVPAISIPPTDADLSEVSSRLVISTPEKVLGDADFTNSLDKKQNEATCDKWERIQRDVVELETQCSDQENTIEFLKTKMVKLLVTKKMEEHMLNTELQRRDQAIHELQSSSEENADHSQQMITDLEASRSCLEDQIEKLKVENVRLRVTSQMLKEEKDMAEEEMKALKTDVQSYYIDNSHYGIS